MVCQWPFSSLDISFPFPSVSQSLIGANPPPSCSFWVKLSPHWARINLAPTTIYGDLFFPNLVQPQPSPLAVGLELLDALQPAAGGQSASIIILMKKTQPGQTFFFVDESGDPTFYDRNGNLIVGQGGCSSLLILGMVEISDPVPLRQAILGLQTAIANDPYFAEFPSIQKTKIAFHAKDDLPEVRYQFYKLLAGFDFQAQFVVARKIERVFRNSFHSKENEFYDHLITLLFESKLHLHEQNYIYFAKRGSRNRQAPIENAIEKSIQIFEQKWNTKSFQK